MTMSFQARLLRSKFRVVLNSYSDPRQIDTFKKYGTKLDKPPLSNKDSKKLKNDYIVSSAFA